MTGMKIALSIEEAADYKVIRRITLVSGGIPCGILWNGESFPSSKSGERYLSKATSWRSSWK